MYEEFYDDYSEGSEVKEIKGITDTVTDYTYTGLSYPCVMMKEGIQLERHKIQVVSNIVKSNAAGVVKDIALYFNNNDQIYKLGNIAGNQVSSLIDIIGRNKLTAFLSEGKELKGSLIYTLCTV